MSITIFQGSILDLDVDCIVNPANGHLRHDGGLAAIIDKAAQGPLYGKQRHGQASGSVQGPVAKWHADHHDAPLIPTGGAHLTSAGCLPFEAVIHAVGPIWGGGAFWESQLLTAAHLSAMELAQDAGFESIAFPAISCGIFGYPVGQASRVAVASVLAFGAVGVGSLPGDLDVTFALVEDGHVAAYRSALEVAEAYSTGEPING